MKRFDVYIINNLQQTAEIEQAKQKLMVRFKLSGGKAQSLLDKGRVVIKKDVDEAKAAQFQRVIEQCGLSAELVSADDVLELDLTSGEEVSQNRQASEEEDQNIYRAPEASVEKQLYCRQCGNQMPQSQKVCERCGAENSQESGRSKIVAGFLAFFFGGFGLHRFYLGQWWGIFYIPFYFLFFISSFVSLGEAIYFWACSKETWNRKYGHLGKSSAILILVIAFVPLIAVLGILAAVALPAYQDYTIRAKAAEAYAELKTWSYDVEAFVVETNFVPNSALDAGINKSVFSPYINSVEIAKGGRVIGHLNPFTTTGESYTIVLIPEFTNKDGRYVAAEWGCTGGTLPNKYRPSICRGAPQALTNAHPNSSGQSVGGSTIRSTTSDFYLTMPAGWKTGVTGEQGVSVDIGNVYTEAYAILIEETYDDTYFSSLDEYASAVEESVVEDVSSAQVLTTGVLTTHAGDEGRFLRMSGKVNNLDVIYIFVMFKQGNDYYRLVTWTLKDRAMSNENILKQLAKSAVLPR